MGIESLLLSLRGASDTPDTSANQVGYQREAAPLLACTLDTCDTSDKTCRIQTPPIPAPAAGSLAPCSHSLLFSGVSEVSGVHPSIGAEFPDTPGEVRGVSGVSSPASGEPPAILPTVNAYRRWRVTAPGAEPQDVTYRPPATAAEVLAWWPSGSALAPLPDNPLPMPASELAAHQEAAIRAWLAFIGETDPAIIGEVLTKCRQDPGALAFYLGQAQPDIPSDIMERRRKWLLRQLQERPEIQTAFLVDEANVGPVKVALGIRGIGTCELLIPRDRWDPAGFVALLDGAEGRA